MTSASPDNTEKNTSSPEDIEKTPELNPKPQQPGRNGKGKPKGKAPQPGPNTSSGPQKKHRNNGRQRQKIAERAYNDACPEERSLLAGFERLADRASAANVQKQARAQTQRFYANKSKQNHQQRPKQTVQDSGVKKGNIQIPPSRTPLTQV